MAKKVMAIVKLQLQAGKATPAPPVGPALGQHGVNIMDFVKNYNERTASQIGTVIPVEITIYQDRTFAFICKTPPATALLRAAAGIEKGAQQTGRQQAGKVTQDQIRQIAQSKMPDLNANSLEAATRIIEGTARSMGIEVVSA